MTAVLSTELGNTDKIVEAVRECRRLKVTVAPPSVHESESNFSIKEGTVYFGLAAVKNVGTAAAEAIAAQRTDGPYQEFYDFCVRIDQRAVNRRALESLIKVGALDTMGDRAALLASLDDVLASSQKAQSIGNQGPTLFETFLGEEQAAMLTSFTLPQAEPATPEEKGIWEKELLGDYLSENPFKPHSERMQAAAGTTTAEVTKEKEGKRVTLAGRVESVRKILTRKGQNMALLTLEDESGKIDVTVFPNLYAERAALLVNGNFVVLRGRVEQDSRDDVMKVLAESVEPLDDTVVERQEPDTAMPPVTVAVREGAPLPASNGDLPDWVINANNVPTGRPAVVDEPVAVPMVKDHQTVAAQTVVAPAAVASPRNESVEPEPEQEIQPVAEVLEQTGPEVELVLQRTSDDAQDLGTVAATRKRLDPKSWRHACCAADYSQRSARADRYA